MPMNSTTLRSATTPTAPRSTAVPTSAAARTSAAGAAGPGARRRVPRWSVPLVAAAVSVAVLLVGTALGVDPAVRAATGTQTVGLAAVIVATLVVGYAGWGVRALLGRLLSRRPRGGEGAWLVTCGVVLLVSLLGPLGGVTPGAVALLVVEHVAVGAVLALGLRR